MNNIFFKTFIAFVFLLNMQNVVAQASNYPYFMEHFWPKNYDSAAKVAITNRLIENTSEGRDYVQRLNSLYRDFFQTMDRKNTANQENENYQKKVKQYQNQYDMASATLELAKANYNMCRSNCGGLAQNVNNIVNNMNNLANKMEHGNRIIDRTYRDVQEYSVQLKSIDREQAPLKREVQNYITTNIKNGTISLEK